MNPQKFSIAIYQKPSTGEAFFAILLTLIMFVPFIYGVNTKQPVYCFSMIVGLIGFGIYNNITKGKFLPSGTIQKNILISFSENGIEINEGQESTIYQWSNLEEIEINIYAYSGGSSPNSSSPYNGSENYIRFIKNGEKIKYQFYIENVHQFKLLKEQFHKIILPLLNQYENLKEQKYL